MIQRSRWAGFILHFLSRASGKGASLSCPEEDRAWAPFQGCCTAHRERDGQEARLRAQHESVLHVLELSGGISCRILIVEDEEIRSG